MTIEVRPLTGADRAGIDETIRRRWRSDIVVARGVVHRPAELAGFLAVEDGRPAGLVTYATDGDDVEIVTIDAFETRRGVGRALVEAVVSLGAPRVWLVTTNDNVVAQRFYEALGFRLVAVHEGALERSRALKPEIPLVGVGGVALTDELEYELTRSGRIG